MIGDAHQTYKRADGYMILELKRGVEKDMHENAGRIEGERGKEALGWAFGVSSMGEFG